MMIEKTLKDFVLPEKDVTLKHVFDNARNYLIVGGFVAMARWFELGKATPVPYVFKGPPKTGWGELMWVALTVALLLYLLNLSQSYFIAKPFLKIAFGIRNGSDNSSPQKIDLPWYARFIRWVTAMALLMVVNLIVLLLLTFSFYTVWYAVPEAIR